MNPLNCKDIFVKCRSLDGFFIEDPIIFPKIVEIIDQQPNQIYPLIDPFPGLWDNAINEEYDYPEYSRYMTSATTIFDN